MSYPKDVERWRKFATWEAKDIPVEIVLAIVQHESGGIPGIISQRVRAAGHFEIPQDSGGKKLVKNDLGLMQCSPAVIAAFSSATKTPVTWEDMTGKDERAARLQLRVGSWYFALQVRNVHKYAPEKFPGKTPGNATPEQFALALIAYARGFGDLVKHLDVLKSKGLPLTVESLKKEFPEWTQGPAYASWVMTKYNATRGTVPAIAKETIVDRVKRAANDWALPALLLLGFWFLKNKEQNENS